MQLIDCFRLFLWLPLASGFGSRGHADVAQKWVQASKTFDKLLWPQTSLAIDAIEAISADGQSVISETCVDSLRLLSEGLKKRELWAHKFVDASGKGRAGLAYGYISDIGNIDECLSIDANREGTQIKGQYCLLDMKLPLLNKSEVNFIEGVNFSLNGTELEGTVYETYAKSMELMMYTTTSFKFGLCFPSTCDYKQIEKSIQTYFKETGLDFSILPFCETVDRPMRSHHKVALVIAILYIAFLVSANLVEYVKYLRDQYEEKPTTFMSHFNIMRNTSKLFVESKDPMARKIAFFHGIRAFYQIVAISGHMSDIQPLIPSVYPVFYDRSDNQIWLFKQAYRSTGFAVQIAFAISGCMTSCLLYPIFLQRKGKVSFSSFAITKWLRSSPTMIGVIVFSFVWAGLGSGPILRQSMETYVETCTTYWWANLLYINNWFPHTKMCLFHTWSFSADFQMYLISFFVLYLMATKPKQGLLSVFGLILLGIFLPALVTYWKDLPPYPNFDGSDAREYEVDGYVYFHTYNCIASYFSGFLVGYLIVKDIKPSMVTVLTGWVFVVAIGLLNIYVPFQWSVAETRPSRWKEIAYAGLHRIFFVSGFIWSGYLSAFQLGAPVQHFYELKMLVPFSRMSTSVFLAHFSFVWFDIPNGTEYMPTRAYNWITKYCYGVIMSWAYSYIIYLCFEAPSTSLLKERLKNKESEARFEHKQFESIDSNSNSNSKYNKKLKKLKGG